VLFDVETGHIIPAAGDKGAVGGPTLNAIPSPPHPDHDAAPQSDASKMLEEFPINFDGAKQ